MISLHDVSKFYASGSPVLQGINLHIQPGEFVSIVGQSGAGKTTLVKLLIAEEKPNKGRIELGGWDITDIAPNVVPYLRRQIGVIFQDFKLLPKKTVFENVSFALEVAGAESSRIQQIVPQVLHLVGLGLNSALRASHENLRVFVYFPPQEKPYGFSIPCSNPIL
jgi:cell division transport system ATP-binding protein